DWFILGPILVALAVLGDAFRTRGRSLTGGAALLSATLGACLVNPHHIHVFAIPPELTAMFGSSQAAFPALGLAPIHLDYYETSLVRRLAVLLIFPLALLGAVSFVLNVSGPGVWRRLPIWAVLLALALIQARAVPFFAIAAGPMMARNFQEWCIRRWGDLFET